jgi:hypothetical protein
MNVTTSFATDTWCAALRQACFGTERYPMLPINSATYVAGCSDAVIAIKKTFHGAPRSDAELVRLEFAQARALQQGCGYGGPSGRYPTLNISASF